MMTIPPVCTDLVGATGGNIDPALHGPDNVDLLLPDLGNHNESQMTVMEAEVAMTMMPIHHGKATLLPLQHPLPHKVAG